MVGRCILLFWLVVLVVAGCGDDGDSVPSGSGTLTGSVLVSGPLRGASIAVDQLDLKTGEVHTHVGDTSTDDNGQFSLPTNTANGLLLVTASGGTFVDRASGATIQLDPSDRLETIVEAELLEEVSGILVSPIGHLVAARSRFKLQSASLELDDAFSDATDHLNDHFGNVDWQRAVIADLSQRASSPTEPVRAALVHTALSYLVNDIASAAGASPQEVNVFRLAQLWAEDIGQGVFDGNDNNDKGSSMPGALQLGVCPPVPADCVAPPNTTCLTGSCRPLCDLYVGTPRALLGGVVTKIIGNKEINKTELEVADILPVARAISERVDDDLFGGSCIETLDRIAPTVQFSSDSPSDGSFVRLTQTLKVTAIDDVDPNPVARFQDLPDTDGDLSNNVAIATFDTTSFPDGNLSVLAFASDLSGNTGSSGRVLIVDNTAPVVTPSSADFFVDGSTWWTATATPVLTGNVTEANPDTVKARIGGVDYAGSFTGAGFTIAVPANTISQAGRDVTIIVTDKAGNEGSSTTLLIRYDPTPPVLALGTASVFDEEMEVPAFAANEDISHVHANPKSLDVAPPACPSFTKFSYLLTASTPPYVSETQPNPILYPLKVTDDGVGVQPMTTQYKVSRRTGASSVVVRDWTAVPAGQVDGASTLRHDIGIYDGAVAGLASNEGIYDVEFRATDRLGRVSPAFSRCFDLKLRAPPIRVQAGGASTGHSMALDFITLTGANTLIAKRLLDPATKGAALIEQRFVNSTTSPITLTVNFTRPNVASVDRRFRWDWYPASTRATSIGSCYDPNPGICAYPSTPQGYLSPTSPVTDPTDNIGIRLFPVSGGINGTIQEASEITCNGCMVYNNVTQDSVQFTIPARMVGGPPLYFSVMMVVGYQPNLAPTDAVHPAAAPYADRTLGTGKYDLTPEYEYCSASVAAPTAQYPDRERCTQMTTLRHANILTAASINFTGAIDAQLLTAPVPTITPRPTADIFKRTQYLWTRP